VPIAPKNGPVHKVFVGPEGIRAGWRLATFLLLFAALQYVVIQRGLRAIPALGRIANLTIVDGVLTPQFELVFESAYFVLALLAAWIMSRIEKRSMVEYGIPLKGAFGKLFWQGVVWGLAYETVEMLGIYALGGFSFGTLAVAGAALLKFAFFWAVGMVFVGLYEEFAFRGYGQFTVTSGIGFWPAAVLLSGIFGATHLLNRGEGWVGALSVFVFGMFACFTLRRTGNLWFAIGLHAAADYAETFIFSVPDSGMVATGHLLNSSFHGPRWLTGGSIGPEGSVLAFVFFAVLFAAFNWMYPAKKAPAL
jgi:uncharacterized protein